MIAGCSKKYFCFFSVSVAIFAAFFVLFNTSYAEETNEPKDIYDRDKAIQIASEKGGPSGCDSEAACDAFCSNSANQAVCMDWGLANGVISQENYDKYNGFSKIGGPGGCKTSDECKSYCDDESHFNACIESGERLGIISEQQAKQARKTGPGGCRTQKDCQAFCEQPGNHDICIEHAVQEGFMTKEEAQRIKEFQTRADELRKKAEEFRKHAEEFEKPEIEEIDPGFDEDKAKQILATQGGPGGCKTFDACEDFCENPDNQLTCFEFAEQNNLFTNRDHAEKIKRFMQEGGPGGCHGEKACRSFCENEANFEVCLQFAEKHELMPPEEIERAKKGIQALKEGGPVGCKTKESCDQVCQNPANQEACFDWARKHGLISEEEVKFIEESKKFREKFEHRKEGLEGGFERFEGQRPPENFRPPGEFLGPGGCKGADECRKYCEDPAHKEECGGLSTPSGQQPPGFGGTPPSESGDNGGIVCPQVYDPVCGSDGRTYPNECEAHRTGASAKYKGKCETSNYPEPTKSEQPYFSPQLSPSPYHDPITECAKSGGIWTDNYCKLSEPTHSPSPSPTYSPPSSPAPLPSPSTHETIDPATECAKRGGTWTGTECKLSSAEPTSFRDHPFLGAMLRYLLK